MKQQSSKVTQFEILYGDGNAYSVMSRVSSAIRKKGASNEDIKLYQATAKSGDYDNLIRVSMEWLTRYEYK